MNRLTEGFLRRRFGRSVTFPEAMALLAEPGDGTQELKDMAAAIETLMRWKEEGRNVCVLPDYDMDGISSGIIGFAGLSELGFKCSLFEPDASRGYGFDETDIDRLMKEHPHTNAIITCDVGIGCDAGISWAMTTYGCEVIVTDHHKEDTTVSPRFCEDAPCAVVNPMREDETYREPGICGARVLWEVLNQLAEKMYGRASVECDAIARLRLFAGLGTISDVMPMRGTNRDLVTEAMSLMRLAWSDGDRWFVDSLVGSTPYKQAFVGVHTLLNELAHAGRIESIADIDEDFVGFTVAPMFNCVKRMNLPVGIAFGVFFGDAAEECAKQLIEANEERKAITRSAWDHIREVSDTNGVLWLSDAPHGVLGVLAARKADETGMPCLMLSDKDFDGSGRCPDWLDGLSITTDAIENLRQTGAAARAAGHEGAFGCSFDSLATAQAVAQVLAQQALLAVPSEVVDESDAHLTVSDGKAIDMALLAEFAADVSYLAPYGRTFAPPKVRIEFPCDVATWRTMGSESQHMKATVPGGLQIISWNDAQFALAHKNSSQVASAYGTLSMHEWNGAHSLQVICDEIRMV